MCRGYSDCGAGFTAGFEVRPVVFFVGRGGGGRGVVCIVGSTMVSSEAVEMEVLDLDLGGK
jgi:hypothetical protein